MIKLHLLDMPLDSCAFGALQLRCVQHNGALKVNYDLVQIKGLLVGIAFHQGECNLLECLWWYMIDSVVANGSIAPFFRFS